LTRPRGYISWSLLEKLVDQCSGRPFGLDTLHGAGEPLLWNRLEEAIQLIRSRKAGRAIFATNATLLTEDRAKSLLDAGLTCICIWLDSLDPANYRSTKGTDLDKVIKNIQNLIRIAASK
jgi:molybdenum cofactor biosynthesis enzyme MoaA